MAPIAIFHSDSGNISGMPVLLTEWGARRFLLFEAMMSFDKTFQVAHIRLDGTTASRDPDRQVARLKPGRLGEQA